MTYTQHSVIRRPLACRLTLAEVEWLYWTVQNVLISAHTVMIYATNDNDRPDAERMRVNLNNLLNEVGVLHTACLQQTIQKSQHP